MTLDYLLKPALVFLFIWNIYPRTMFLLFCLLQQSSQTLFGLGEKARPQGNGYHYEQLTKNLYNPNAQTVIDRLKILLEPCNENTDFTHYLSAHFINVLKFQSIYLTYAKLKSHPQLQSYWHGVYPRDPIQTDTSGDQNKLSKSPWHILFDIGIPDNIHLQIKREDKPKSPIISSLQVGSQYRLRLEHSPKSALISLISLLLYLLIPITALKYAFIIGLISSLIYPDNHALLFIGHHPLSFRSYLYTMARDGNPEYNIGTILMNVLINGVAFYGLYLTGISPVNILPLFSRKVLYAACFITCIDRLYMLLQKFNILKHSFQGQRPLGPGIKIPSAISGIILPLHNMTYQLLKTEISASP